VSASSLPGVLVMVGAVAVITLNDAGMKFALAELPGGQAIALRGALAAVMVLTVVAIMGHLSRLADLGSWPVARRTLVEMAGLFTWIAALPHIALSTAIALYMTTPLMMLLTVAVLDGVRLSAWRLFLVAAGFSGAVMVVQPRFDASLVPALLVVVSGALTVMRDRLSRRVPATTPPLVVTLSVLSAAVVMGLVMGLGEEWRMPGAAQAGAIALAAICLAAGLTGLYLAYRMAPAEIVAPYLFTQVVWALLLGFLVFGERPNGLALFGMGIVALVGIALSRPERARQN
jgi:drug/metabolite transporter (DMT)-like permease